MVLGNKTNFCLGKTKKNNPFGLWPHSFPKDCFCVYPFGFPRKNWFSGPKLSFSKRTLENNLIAHEKKPKKHVLRVWAHSVVKDGIIGSFGFPQGKLVFDWKSTVLLLSACSRRT